MEDLISNVIILLNDFLLGKLDAESMRNKYDDLLADNLDWESSNPKVKMLDEFQNELSLYEGNPE
jgi:hypothetical protein